MPKGVATANHAVPGDRAGGLFWSWRSIEEAHRNLIAKSGLSLTSPMLPGKPDTNFLRSLQWVRRAPRGVGLDAIEETDVSMDRLLIRLLEIDGPILIAVEHQPGESVALTAVLEPGLWARILKPDGTEVRVRRPGVHAAITRLVTGQVGALSMLFDGLPGGKEVFEELERKDALGDGRHVLLMRFVPDGARPIVEQVRAGGGFRALGLHVVLSAAQAAAALGAWWTLGLTLSSGVVDLGRIFAWTLLALSDAPLQFLANDALAKFSRGFWGAVKRRLLEGAFFTSEKDVRSKGFGELIARTNEAAVVEQLSLGDVSGIFLASFQVLGSVVFLARGGLAVASLVALGSCVILTAFLVRAGARAYREVFERGMGLTDDLVDKIIGHRTRAVQESPTERHSAEDFDLGTYAVVAQRLDRIRATSTIMPRIWLIFGAGILLTAFVTRAPASSLLFSGLGILFCYRALVTFFPAVDRVIEWYTAWRAIEAFVVAGRSRDRPSRSLDVDPGDVSMQTTLSMSNVSFGYRAGGRQVLAAANLRIRHGEKVLVEGGSGSGKTTLFKVIAGELDPTAGIVLIGGSDHHSVSEVEWRRRVASAPQFHENYVFSHTFAFNLDPWGEPGVETEEQREICAELGLRPLLERMPQGFAQMVGETGWQLSHGERSRLFIARALLQKSDVFLFDENFGALDPETLIQALECVRRRAKTVLVIAHT